MEKIFKGAQECPVNFNSSLSECPWKDNRKLKRASQLFEIHSFSLTISMFFGLLMMLFSPRISIILKSTGKSSGRYLSFRRYFRTVLHVRTWFRGQIWRPGSPARRSLETVRKIHYHAQLEITKSHSPLIGHMEMIITQFGFTGLALVMPQKLGLPLSRYDKECLVHFWRYVGYLSGIDDRYNLCRGNLEEVQSYCNDILHTEIQSALPALSFDSILLCRYLMQGMHNMVPLIFGTSVAAFLANLLSLTPSPSKIGLFPYFYFMFMRFVFEVLLLREYLAMFFRPIFGGLLSLALTIHKSSPKIHKMFTDMLEFSWDGDILSVVDDKARMQFCNGPSKTRNAVTS